MAKIPYWAIEQKLKEILENDSATSLAKVVLESSLMPTPDVGKYVSIYLKSNNPETITMGFGNNSRENTLEFDIECNAFHAGSLAQSFERRDELLASIQSILQRKNTLTMLRTVPSDAQIQLLTVSEVLFETPQENEQTGFISRAIITINITVLA